MHYYEITLKENLEPRFARRFEGIEILPRPQPVGGTILRGQISDQAALYGVLSKIRDLGLTLIEVRCLDPPGSHPINPAV